MHKGLLPVRWLWELHWRVLNSSWGLKAKMNELCNYLKKEHSEQKWTANTKNVRSELAWWFSSVEKTLWWEVMSCISWLTYRIADEQGKVPRGLLGHHFQMQYKSFILVTFLSKMKKKLLWTIERKKDVSCSQFQRVQFIMAERMEKQIAHISKEREDQGHI